jgi:hypothetical protein
MLETVEAAMMIGNIKEFTFAMPAKTLHEEQALPASVKAGEGRKRHKTNGFDLSWVCGVSPSRRSLHIRNLAVALAIQDHR